MQGCVLGQVSAQEVGRGAGRTVGVQRGRFIVSTSWSTRLVSTSSSCSRLKLAIGKLPDSLNIVSEFTRSRLVRVRVRGRVGVRVGVRARERFRARFRLRLRRTARSG